jgi:hypothetical protein
MTNDRAITILMAQMQMLGDGFPTYVKAIEMAITALREQQERQNQYRVPSKEEWMETYCTPKQLAGYQQKKNT